MGVLFSDQVEYVDSAPSEEKVKKKKGKTKGGRVKKKKILSSKRARAILCMIQKPVRDTHNIAIS